MGTVLLRQRTWSETKSCPTRPFFVGLLTSRRLQLDGFYYNDGLLPDSDITARVGAYFGYAADSSGELVR